MQGMNWNDLRYLLALYRGGTLRRASQTLRTSETTVARRIRVLEEQLGTSLFLRNGLGQYEPTDATLRILPHAEVVEGQSLALQDSLSQTAGQITGRVRMSSVPIIVNRILVPGLAALQTRHPQLSVDLVPAANNLDLSKREADLALRFARPTKGGLRTKAQKLGALTFGIYGPREVPPDHADGLDWITYDAAFSDLPQARWLERAVSGAMAREASVQVADAETALSAVAHGLGKTLLPDAAAKGDPRVQRLPASGDAALPVRDVWLLSHADQEARASVAAAKEWLAGLDWS